jgi:hypothetical protein
MNDFDDDLDYEDHPTRGEKALVLLFFSFLIGVGMGVISLCDHIRANQGDLATENEIARLDDVEHQRWLSKKYLSLRGNQAGGARLLVKRERLDGMAVLRYFGIEDGGDVSCFFTRPSNEFIELRLHFAATKSVSASGTVNTETAVFLQQLVLRMIGDQESKKVNWPLASVQLEDPAKNRLRKLSGLCLEELHAVLVSAESDLNQSMPVEEMPRPGDLNSNLEQY